MVMLNIGVFIVWGFIIVLFILIGFFLNESFVKLVDLMVKYLFLLLIGYIGGKFVYDQCGGVVGVIVIMGVIVGFDILMFLGVMIMGLFGGYIIKKFDQFIEGKVKIGFEMLINNFLVGIFGGILVILVFLGVSLVVDGFIGVFVVGVDWMVVYGFFLFISILIELVKILFLNNVINYGILFLIGVE